MNPGQLHKNDILVMIYPILNDFTNRFLEMLILSGWKWMGEKKHILTPINCQTVAGEHENWSLNSDCEYHESRNFGNGGKSSQKKKEWLRKFPQTFLWPKFPSTKVVGSAFVGLPSTSTSIWGFPSMVLHENGLLLMENPAVQSFK